MFFKNELFTICAIVIVLKPKVLFWKILIQMYFYNYLQNIFLNYKKKKLFCI